MAGASASIWLELDDFSLASSSFWAIFNGKSPYCFVQDSLFFDCLLENYLHFLGDWMPTAVQMSICFLSRTGLNSKSMA
jgi:hypothetical protein